MYVGGIIGLCYGDQGDAGSEVYWGFLSGLGTLDSGFRALGLFGFSFRVQKP